MKIDQGLVHCYTGDGKGKTTAALGLALRALGWGLRVLMVQFVKGYANIGEIKFAEHCDTSFTVRQFSLDLSRTIDDDKVRSRRKEASEAMEFAEKSVISGDFDVVILDELNVALHYELIDVERALTLIRSKPANVELIITGRNAPDRIMEAADYVTEMHLVRHPYQNGIKARSGVDY